MEDDDLYDQWRLRTMSNEQLRVFTIDHLKPMFDKMLASLKAAKVAYVTPDNPVSLDAVDEWWNNLDAIIKEAEELGL